MPFGPFEVHECIGVGGMATVHRATLVLADGTTREVALKRMLPHFADNEGLIEDFVREAQLAAQLDHPNIVKILQLGRIGKAHFIAMELVSGDSLLHVLQKSIVLKQPAPIGVVTMLMIELCGVLEHVANAVDRDGSPLRIVHRDLSPSNLLLTDEGHLKVIDFGVAKAVKGRFATETGLLKGKLGYMSTEALDHAALDPRHDIFAAGVVMWELLAGRRLFRGEDEAAIIERIRSGAVLPPSVRNPSCPTELDDIVMKALARDREQRWQTGKEMRAALEEVRRYYAGQCSAREVVRWMQSVAGESSQSIAAKRADSEVDMPVKQAWRAISQAEHSADDASYQEAMRAVGGENWLDALELAELARAESPAVDPYATARVSTVDLGDIKVYFRHREISES